jgi:outer membrane receptor for ferrienterochelin and colicins
MKRITTIMSLVLMLFAQLSIAQSLKVSGTVLDGESNQPLPGVNILVDGSRKGVSTDIRGQFEIDVAAGDVLVFSFIGFETQRISVTGNGNLGNIVMSPKYLVGDELIISVTRNPERLTDAPASISVITSKDLDLIPTYNISEFLNKVQGVEVVRSGVLGVGINARGFNSAFNFRMLQLNDGRNGMLPGGTGLPAGIYNTIIKEDIERVEVILGPASALYGPNAHAGVVNTITKDPRTSQGTTLVVGAGNQNQLSTRFRHAQEINSNLAFKLNFEHTRGTDFEFIDSVYVNNVAFAELDPDFDFSITRGNAAVYYNVGRNADIIVDYGFGQGSNIGVTNLGRNQINGWTFQYLNARFVSDRWFATVYNTWNNAGETWQINGRTANYATLLALGESDAEARRKSLLPVDEGGLGFPGFVDKSSRFNAEVQFNETIGDDFRIIAGASYQRDQAFSDGTYLYDIDGDIVINQVGAVAQVEKPFAGILKFVGAARLDHHDYYGFQFSPRAALTAKAGDGSFRATVSRAYAAPPIQFLEFLFPFGGGAIIGSGQGLTVQEFSTSLITQQTTLGATREIQPLQPEEVLTYEVGYKGSPIKNLYFEATGWLSNSRNFLSPAVSLFAVNMTTFAIEGERIIARGGQPIPEEFGNLHITYLNYGQVQTWGADFGFTYAFNRNFSVGAKYMYFNSSILDEGKFDDDENFQKLSPLVQESLITLNAPNHRANFNLTATELVKGLFTSINVRWVPEYDFMSGQQRATAAGAGTRVPGTLYNYGPLGGFTTVDFSVGYRINKMFQLGGSVTNLFDVEQREFVGSPNIGRLINAELRIDLPAIGKK